MNNVFVYLEIEGTTVADVSLELLTKGRKLANQLGCQLEAVAAGNVEAANDAVKVCYHKMDKAVAKGVIHKNQASNRKSGVAKLVNKISA